MSENESPLMDGLLESLLGDESYRPAEPRTLEETGLSQALVEQLILKYLLAVGSRAGRDIADRICIPFGLIEPIFQSLRQRQLLIHSGAAQLNDYAYGLTDQGMAQARRAMELNSYVGPAPVPLVDYVMSVEAQTIRAEPVRRRDLERAFEGVSVEKEMFEILGPAINSGAGLFMYGEPGNGKTTLAKRITRCFGQEIWVPHVIVEDGQLIKLFDAAFHEAVESSSQSILKSASHDRRWIRIRRPTVVVGGELTLDALEVRFDPIAKVGEAPLQLKSNCGCLLIDDFGRQKMEPSDLLNRWIVPLENRHDFLTIASGKKIQVPFEQLIIFSTNLEPSDLADDAFLRRIPYKVEVGDPALSEYQFLWELSCKSFDCDYDSNAIEHLVKRHYRPFGRPLRRCQPRDLLQQVRNYCAYNDKPLELRTEYLDHVVKTYFTVMAAPPGAPAPAPAPAASKPPSRPAAKPAPNPAATPAAKPARAPSKPGGERPAERSTAPPRAANQDSAARRGTNSNGDSTTSPPARPAPVDTPRTTDGNSNAGAG